MLVELANDPPVYKGLIDLFSEFGIQVHLDSVEKVFAKKAHKLDFFEMVKDQVPQDARLIYDAGVLWYILMSAVPASMAGLIGCKRKPPPHPPLFTVQAGIA